MRVEIETFYELPPSAAIPLADKFLSEVWTLGGIQAFDERNELDYEGRKGELVKIGIPENSSEYRKLDQVRYHLRHRALVRFEKLKRLDLVNSRIRERLA
jgi:hypothetical protein